MELDNYIGKRCWKKYATVLVVSLVCHFSSAEVTPRYFQTVDELIAAIKQEEPKRVHYDSNGVIEGLELQSKFGTDRDLRLLSNIKSIRYLHIGGGALSTNAIPALVEYPNLTGLGLVCCGGPRLDLGPQLPSLTNLQSLYLAQSTYQPNDAVYLARMTNLTALVIAGYVPQPQVELPPLTNLVNLRTFALYGLDDWINKVNTNMFSTLKKLTNFVVTSEPDLLPHEVWKTPAVKTQPSETIDLHRPVKN